MKNIIKLVNLKQLLLIIAIVIFLLCAIKNIKAQNYKIIGTSDTLCYNNSAIISCPANPTTAFYGQYSGSISPSYQNNGDGTISDLNTGLMWQKSPDENGNNNGAIEKADKLYWYQVPARLAVLNSTNYAGHNDWRIPTMKELFSLSIWTGYDPSGYTGTSTTGLIPYIDNTIFSFGYGQTPQERLIDAQYISCNFYNDINWQGYTKIFGMNYADGRIKGYDTIMPDGTDKLFSFVAVRGNTSYGINNFTDNVDSTITDNATKLMWAKNDSKSGMNWQSALAYAQNKNAANYCGYNDWRLPNVKELQSIIDYTRSPEQGSASIDPIFNISTIISEGGTLDWPYFWTSTTHKALNTGTSTTSYDLSNADYVCFGRAAGWVKKTGNTYYSYYDAHGAGAQRSDPKSGTYFGELMGVDSLGNSVYAHGPQGDILRIYNYVRLVRGGSNILGINNIKDKSINIYPNPTKDNLTIETNINTEQRIEILNLIGQTVYTIIINKKATINTSAFANGVYILKLSSDKETVVRKFVKE